MIQRGRCPEQVLSGGVMFLERVMFRGRTAFSGRSEFRGRPLGHPTLPDAGHFLLCVVPAQWNGYLSLRGDCKELTCRKGT